MIVDLTVRKNIEIFRQAWTEVVVPKYNTGSGTSIEESQRIWLNEFGCRMVYSKSGFSEAHFEDESDYAWFLLRWA